MNDVVNLTIYEQACSKCIDDLYHVAYLAFVDSDKAEELVTKVCVAGLHKYGNIEDEGDIRYRLTSDLYHLCRRRLWLCMPSTDMLPVPLQVLTKSERLLIAMCFASGLSAAETCGIVGLSEDRYSKKVSEILKKSYKPV